MKDIKLKYFKASREESIFDEDEKYGLCFFCKTDEFPQVELDESVEIITESKEEIEIVCLDCLLKEKYAFKQIVEGGFLTKDGIVKESDKYEYLKDDSNYLTDLLPLENQLLNMDKLKIKNLTHTPPFRTWQDATWLVHCKDFMTFIGTWEHEDFVKNSPDGNAKEFFDDILDNWNGDDFYDKQFGPDKSEYAESTFYAFQCQGCKKYRGFVDNA